MNNKFDVILLAAQRTGVVNPLAKAHDVSHKCLIPIAGKSLIQRILEILSSHQGCRAIYVLIEPDGEEKIRNAVEKYTRDDLPITFITSDENIAASVIKGCNQAEAPYLVTTADNVLLKHDSIDQALAMMNNGADAVAALAEKTDIHAVHPLAQRGFYDFRDGGYANCNLYGLKSNRALDAANIFREGGQFMGNPGRLVRAFGLFNIFLMRFRLVTIDQAFRRMSKRFGVAIRRLPLSDGTQAIDVDNERTYKIVEAVLTDTVDKLDSNELDKASTAKS
ncbi:NTP transferase domain-containing protein [Sphingorhabdus sp. Alg239-R122]|uniref:NTP transferase domain-containing protein n=1 Tax=Sphingorhabdus sp. Alg239-R122 TaxID=2305989 RepID=UPI0013DD1B11|nr:NTP transferase domain-containing protein [Sphingorhabdus sp. Alg239-R122]